MWWIILSVGTAELGLDQPIPTSTSGSEANQPALGAGPAPAAVPVTAPPDVETPSVITQATSPATVAAPEARDATASVMVPPPAVVEEATAPATVTVPPVVQTPVDDKLTSDPEKIPQLASPLSDVEGNLEGAQGTQDVTSHQTAEAQQSKEYPNGVTICDGEQLCSGHGRCLQKNERTKCKCQPPYTGTDCSESEADGFAPSNSAFTPEEVPQQMDGAGGETALEDQTSSFNFDSGSVYGRLLIFAIICGAAVCGVLVFTCRGSRRSSPASYKALSTAEGETEVHEEADEEAGQWGWDDDCPSPQVQLPSTSKNDASSAAPARDRTPGTL